MPGETAVGAFGYWRAGSAPPRQTRARRCNETDQLCSFASFRDRVRRSFGCDPSLAKEYPIGQAQEKGGMEVGAVYLQPIEMDPPDMMRPAKDSDVHLEADIHAAKGNTNGFAQGDGSLILASTMF